MSNITLTLAVLLVFSLIINGFCVWYIKNLLKRFLFISNNIEDLIQMVSNYRAHLKAVYTLDMFYGDETLKALMEHTTLFSDLLEDYEDVIEVTELQELEEVGDEENQKKEPPYGEKKANQENVFYAGTRRRDT